MEQCAHLRNPTDSTKVVNVVRHPHLFTRCLDFVEEEAAFFAGKHDAEDKENETCFKEFLVNSISDDMARRVNGIAQQEDLALVTFVKIMRELQILSKEEGEEIKQQLKDMTITTFKRQDKGCFSSCLSSDSFLASIRDHS